MKISQRNIFDGEIKSPFLWMVFLVVFISTICGGPSTKRKNAMPKVTINERLYSDLKNSSSSAFEPFFAKKELWSILSIPPSSRRQCVQSLAIINDALVVKYTNPAFAVYSRLNGNELWYFESSYQFYFSIIDAAIACIKKLGEIALVSIDKNVVRSSETPFFMDSGILLLSLKDNEICYVLNHQPQKSSGPGSVSGPQVEFIRYNENTQSFLLVHGINGALQNVVYSDSDASYYLHVDFSLYRVPLNATKESDVEKLPFDSRYHISLSDDGLIATINEHDKKHYLQMHKPSTLEPIWECELPGSKMSQPPAVVADDLVYLVSGNELLAVDSGRVMWSDSLPCAPGEAFFTVTKNHNVLVAAGNALILYKEDGTILNRMFFETPLVCRPIIDETGKIYVAGQLKIYCIE